MRSSLFAQVLWALAASCLLPGCAGVPAAPVPRSQPRPVAAHKTIHAAAAAGDAAGVRSFLSQGVGADAQDAEGRTPLMVASANGQTAAVDELLGAGASPAAKDKNGDTALHWAAWNGRTEVVHRLLGRGAEANARNARESTPLMWAAAAGHLDVMRALVSMGAAVDTRNGEGSTALHMAAGEGKVPAVEFLISKGADVDAADKSGTTPIVTAGWGRHADAVTALAKAGARAVGNPGMVGLQVKESSGTIEVVEAMQDKPAGKAGVRAGDVIIAVDGSSMAGFKLDDVVKRLRGTAGTKVVFTVTRRGVDRPLDFTVVREAVVSVPFAAGGAPQTPEGAPGRQGRAAPSPAPPAPLSSDADDPRYRSAERPDDIAVVIGIERYAKLVEARFAERDAQAVRRHLLALGVPQRNLIMLEGPAATRAGIQGYVEEWLPRNVKPDSRVYFYYSGHGAPDPATGDAFLVPWDGDPMFLKSSAYPLRELFSRLGRLGAGEVVVALDACFSGAGGRSVLARGARPLVAKVRESVLPQGNVSLLTASADDEITATLEEEGHGIFTYHLLKGLNEGKRSSRALFDYLKPRVSDDARRQNREQTPGFKGSDIRF